MAHHHELDQQREDKRLKRHIGGLFRPILFPLTVPTLDHQRGHHDREGIDLQFGVQHDLQSGQYEHHKRDQHTEKAHTRHAQLEQHGRSEHADTDCRHQDDRAEDRTDLKESDGDQHGRKQAKRLHSDKTAGQHDEEGPDWQRHQQVGWLHPPYGIGHGLLAERGWHLERILGVGDAEECQQEDDADHTGTDQCRALDLRSCLRQDFSEFAPAAHAPHTHSSKRHSQHSS